MNGEVWPLPTEPPNRWVDAALVTVLVVLVAWLIFLWK